MTHALWSITVPFRVLHGHKLYWMVLFYQKHTAKSQSLKLSAPKLLCKAVVYSIFNPHRLSLAQNLERWDSNQACSSRSISEHSDVTNAVTNCLRALHNENKGLQIRQSIPICWLMQWLIVSKLLKLGIRVCKADNPHPYASCGIGY